MTTVCKECEGLGSVPFTKERGGPCCNNCGGYGFMKREYIRRVIGSILDHPSVYMGGPSHGSLKKADRIIDYLEDQNIL
jgi:hypothetical protein